VPTTENVLLKLLPALMFPLSKLLSSPVTVCVMLSLLFHFTVVPGDTVIEAGVKLIFTMLTVLDEGGGAVLLELLPLEHEIKTVENNKLKLTSPVILLMFFIFFN